jgi:hypothetical protein
MRKHMKVNQRAFNTRCEFDNFALLEAIKILQGCVRKCLPWCSPSLVL